MLDENPQDTKPKLAVHCAGGVRSRVVSAFLKSRGYDDIVTLSDKFSDMVDTGIKSIPKESHHRWIK